MRPRLRPPLSAGICLGALAQAPAPPVPVESYLLTLHRSAVHPRMVLLEIVTPDTRALHVDQLADSGGTPLGSLDVAGSGEPPDGRLARYEFRGETDGSRVRLAVRLPDGVRLQIDRAVEGSPSTLSLLVRPSARSGASGAEATLRVTSTGPGKAGDLTFRAPAPVLLTWDDRAPVQVAPQSASRKAPAGTAEGS